MLRVELALGRIQMKPTKLQWEDVIRFEEVEGYGKSIWKIRINII